MTQDIPVLIADIEARIERLTEERERADKAVVLSDEEQSALVQILDAATKAQGISIATNTVYFLNKIKSAPTVVPHVDAPAPKPKDSEE